MLRQQLRPAVVMSLVLCGLTGLVYPGIVTALAQALFPHQANGSLVTAGGRVVGSALLGQRFTRPEYFQGRHSAAGAAGYDARASGGSNLGPTNRALAAAVAARVDAAVSLGATRGRVPTDMVTASASGLDPHVSPANARLQVARVARIRGVDAETLRALVERHVEGRQFGILGEPRVNVLLLNLAVDSLYPSHAGAAR